jgi:gliding motility-associated-like protein
LKKLIFIVLIIPTLAFSQQEASVWYFGQNAGLKFETNGTVTPLGNGQLNTEEGCSSIADGTGNLLFYTDGRTVWDRNHIPMPNGSFANGTELYGDSSSTQSAIIVPKPNDPNIYYVFTVDEPHHENALVYPNAFVGNYVALGSGSVPITDDGRNNGFNYSVIDLSVIGSNGSIGNIVSRNNHLVTYDTNPTGEEIKYKCAEKITAIKNEVDGSYWVITQFINKFFAFKVTSSGVITTPVVSAVGSNQTLLGYRRNAIGYLKASPDGRKLAIAHSENGTILGNGSFGTGNIELFNFDGATGIVSNPITVLPNVQAYGVEFSPNSEKLYATYRVDTNVNMELSQFDLLATDIPNSKVIIDNQQNYLFALQLAPNNKIYCATAYVESMGVINNPNSIGLACNYVQDGQPLATNTLVKLGLPPFITSFFNASFTVENFCLGSATQFTLNNTTGVTSVSWDFGDGSPLSNVLNPSHNYLTAGNYTVTLTATAANGTSSKSRTITIAAIPVVANTVANQSVCGSDAMNYNLSQFNSTLLGSQSNTLYGVTYFLSSSDATNHVNVLSTNYSLPLGVTTIYAKVYNLSNTSCHVITNFSVSLFQQPVANTVTDYLICENLPYNNIEQFDLSTKNASILGTQSATDFTVSYHSSQSNADTNVLPLPLLYNNTLPQETIYARIENNSNPACFDTVSFQIKVIQQPIISPVTDFILCDDSSNNGIETFDLSQKTLEIVNGQSQSVFQVKYFLNLADAQSEVNQINAPINNSTNNQIIYYSISAIGNSICKATSSFKLIVVPFTLANTPNNIFVCDDVTNDGVAVFNLNTNISTILGTQSASQLGISYHLSQNDANTNSNPLPLNFQNTSNPQTIFVRVENNQKQSCFATTSFQIGLYKMPIANQPQDMFLCDDQSNDGDEVFDLSQQNNTVLGTQAGADFNISYHLSSTEAESGTNPLPSIYNNTTNPQTIYVRIENKLSTTCFKTTSFQLFVKPRPVLTLNDTYSICEGNEITITAPIGFSSYTWSNGGSDYSTVIQQAGNYTIAVTQDYGDIICDITKPFIVVNSNIATITQIITSDWTDTENTISVIVTGDGIYEYSIDGFNYQDSNIFTGLRFGEYIVYVRDKNGCGIKEQEIFLLMYPKFFTPNGDGFNDNWQIKFSSTEPNMNITIFDRYGKLITNFIGTSFGWDGIYNGKLLPSDDYWFVVKRGNGKEYKGHFTLKR